MRPAADGVLLLGFAAASWVLSSRRGSCFSGGETAPFAGGTGRQGRHWCRTGGCLGSLGGERRHGLSASWRRESTKNSPLSTRERRLKTALSLLYGEPKKKVASRVTCHANFPNVAVRRRVEVQPQFKPMALISVKVSYPVKWGSAKKVNITLGHW